MSCRASEKTSIFLEMISTFLIFSKKMSIEIGSNFGKDCTAGIHEKFPGLVGEGSKYGLSVTFLQVTQVWRN